MFADGIPLPLLYAEAGQINAIMPYSVQPGTRLMVTVEYEGRRSPPLAMDVVSSAFQLFSLNGTGAGQAVAFNEDGRLNSPSNRAQPGSIVVVYGTGAGLTTPAAADGVLAPLGPLEVLPRPRGKVVAQLSGYSVVAFGEVLYAGAAPGLVNGLTQINFRLPDTPFPSNFSGMYPAFSIDGGTLGSGQVSIWVRGTEP